MRVSGVACFLSIFKMGMKVRKWNFFILFCFLFVSIPTILFLRRSLKTNESDKMISFSFFTTSIVLLVFDFYFPHFFSPFLSLSLSAFHSVIRINIRISLIFMSFWMFFAFSFAIHRILFENGKWDEGKNKNEIKIQTKCHEGEKKNVAYKYLRNFFENNGQNFEH